MISNNYFKEYKTNLIIALPIVASQVGHITVGIADSIMVGSLGGESLAAVTVAFSVYIPFMMLGIGISYGVSPLVAKANGEKNPKEIASLLKHSMLLNALIGIIIFCFCIHYLLLLVK